MMNDCPNCWSENTMRIENQKVIAYCEDCGCWYNMITGEIYDKEEH